MRGPSACTASASAATREAALAGAVLHGLTVRVVADGGGRHDLSLPRAADQAATTTTATPGSATSATPARGGRTGADDLLDAQFAFVTAHVLDDGPDLRPAYASTAARCPDERRLRLPGYPGR